MDAWEQYRRREKITRHKNKNEPRASCASPSLPQLSNCDPKSTSLNLSLHNSRYVRISDRWVGIRALRKVPAPLQKRRGSRCDPFTRPHHLLSRHPGVSNRHSPAKCAATGDMEGKQNPGCFCLSDCCVPMPCCGWREAGTALRGRRAFVWPAPHDAAASGCR